MWRKTSTTKTLGFNQAYIILTVVSDTHHKVEHIYQHRKVFEQTLVKRFVYQDDLKIKCILILADISFKILKELPKSYQLSTDRNVHLPLTFSITENDLFSLTLTVKGVPAFALIIPDEKAGAVANALEAKEALFPWLLGVSRQENKSLILFDFDKFTAAPAENVNEFNNCCQQILNKPIIKVYDNSKLLELMSDEFNLSDAIPKLRGAEAKAEHSPVTNSNSNEAKSSNSNSLVYKTPAVLETFFSGSKQVNDHLREIKEIHAYLSAQHIAPVYKS